MTTLKKHEIEVALANEARAVSSGQLKEDNPLDTSETFRTFCEACRRGDLKVCQEMIQAGVNINSRDRHDYTPLILVSVPQLALAIAPPAHDRSTDRRLPRLACAATTK
jgi:ankyrin repeat/BTB/POZ domain-containing protein 1